MEKEINLSELFKTIGRLEFQVSSLNEEVAKLNEEVAKRNEQIENLKAENNMQKGQIELLKCSSKSCFYYFLFILK
jgi:cell division protein FtsB